MLTMLPALGSHCIWNLKSNRHLTPPSLCASQTSMGHQHASAPCLASHQGYSMLTCVLKLASLSTWGGVFISTSVNRRERWPIPMSCRNIGQIASGPAQPPLERRVKRKSGHLTPVTVGSSQHCFDEEFTESFDAVIPGMHSSNSDSWSGVFTATFHIQLNIYRWKHFSHNLCLLILSH